MTNGLRKVILRLSSLVIPMQRVPRFVLDKQMALLSALLFYLWSWPQALCSNPSQDLREEACPNNLLSALFGLPSSFSVSLSFS